MKHDIKTKKDGLQIKIMAEDQIQEALLTNFKLCQKGQCNCPSDEYKKLEDMRVEQSDKELVLDLRSKKEHKFDRREVKKCVDYIVTKVSMKQYQ